MKRRYFITLLCAAVVGGLAFWKRDPLLHSALKNLINNDGLPISENDIASCKLQTAQIEGPYFVKGPVRSDIKEDRRGANLSLQIQVVDENNCSALENAIVEIWHCDARGTYSAYPQQINRSISATIAIVDLVEDGVRAEPTNNTSYLRGSQQTSSEGEVSFQTIIPGWYAGRAPHIHVKVYLTDGRQLTTQLYLPTEFTDDLYATHPDYKAYGPAPINHQNDFVIKQAGGAERLVMPIRQDSESYNSKVRLVV